METTDSKKTLSLSENLANLILTGPQNGEDITYSTFIQSKPLMEKLEQGFAIKNFIEKTNSHDVIDEFKKLEKMTFDKKMQALLLTDEEVKVFNRYSDILPYRRNCVQLPKDLHGENPYINASYVSSSIRGDDKSFIVCQSPLEHTIVDFWRMVIKEKVHTIVMLCKFKAGSRPQSSEYFPCVQNIKFDGFKGVKLVKVIENKEMDLVERHFQVEAGDGTKREVVHYQWEGWPDHGVPEESKHPVLLYLVQKMSERRKLGNQPVIVHCSAGIGRSGTLVSLYNIDQIIRAYNNEKGTLDEEKARISIFSLVRRLREQRFGMVQTLVQYQLIYEMTRKMLKYFNR